MKRLTNKLTLLIYTKLAIVSFAAFGNPELNNEFNNELILLDQYLLSVPKKVKDETSLNPSWQQDLEEILLRTQSKDFAEAESMLDALQLSNGSFYYADEVKRLITSDLQFEQGKYVAAMQSVCSVWNRKLAEQSNRHEMIEIASLVRITSILTEGSRNLGEDFYSGFSDCLRDISTKVFGANHYESITHSGEGSFVASLLDYIRLSEELEVSPRLHLEYFASRWFYLNQTDQHLKAEKNLRLAFTKYAAFTKDSFFIELYYRLAVSLMRQGDFLAAITELLKGIELNKTYEQDERLSSGYYSLAFVHDHLGNYPLARRYYQYSKHHSIEAFKKDIAKQNQQASEADVPPEILFPVNLKLLLLQGKQGVTVEVIDELTELLANILALDEEANQQYQYHYVPGKVALAGFYLDMGMHNHALDHVTEILQNTSTLDPQKIDAYLIQNAIALERAASGQAFSEIKIVELEHLFKKGAKSNYPVRNIRFLGQQIEQLSLKKNYSDIHELARSGTDLILEVSQQGALPEAWFEASNYFWESYLQAILDEYKLSGSQRQLQRLFNTSEFFSQELFHSLRQFRSNSHHMVADNADLLALWSEFITAEKALHANTDDKRYSELRRRADLARERYWSFLVPKADNASRTFSTFEIDDNLPSLPENDLYIRVLNVKDKHYALSLKAGNLDLQELKDDKGVASLASRLKNAKAKRLRRVFSDLQAETLFSLSAQDLTDVTRIIWSPTGYYHHLPFAALNMEKSSRNYRPLGAEISVVRSHSLKAFLNREGSNDLSAAFSVALFGNPALINGEQSFAESALHTWYSSLPSLPGVEREIESIKEIVASHANETRTALGNQANNEFLLSEFSRSASILHIASHAYFDPEYPEHVGVLTVGDSRGNPAPDLLTINELLSKSFSNRLAIISGCETVLGQHYNSTGFNGLTHGLMSSGVASVIGSLWTVSDSASSKLMRSFYTNLLANGGDPIKALSEAKQSLIRNGRFNDPRYWAGFVIDVRNAKLAELNIPQH